MNDNGSKPTKIAQLVVDCRGHVQPGPGLIPGYSGVLIDRFDPATAVGDCCKRVFRVQTGLNEGFKFSEEGSFYSP
jgi:hypothetical protein